MRIFLQLLSLVGLAWTAAAADHWVATWASAQQLVEHANMPPAPGLAGNTLRQCVHVSLGGNTVRFSFSNAYGTNAVELRSVHAALSAGDAAIQTATDHPILFGGAALVLLRPGQVVISDPCQFQLPPLATLTVSISLGQVSPAVTGHPGSRTTSYLQPGDSVSEPRLAEPTKTAHWYYLARVDVLASDSAAVVVALGDSILDGRGSTTDGNDRLTDWFAARLATNSSTSAIAVVNQGIGGNAVVSGGLGPLALERFERDVLALPGARWFILLEGVNDIGRSGGNSGVITNLIAAYRQLAAGAHAHQLKAFAVPILPFGGSMYFSEAHEAARQAVNSWIRANRDFDAVIDLEAVVRDPTNPTALLKEYDSGDHLHLNPAGYRRMAEAVPLSLFIP
ncbi:MAG TPA: SGNH/GDSL hydrolase family protein [Patescibacteria group bacterium]|nr:SGNH/GDSL hydrolase family protein [Patescibacteria group bacterium]